VVRGRTRRAHAAGTLAGCPVTGRPERAPSVEIRDARVEEARAIAEVHVASWQAAYRGLLPAEVLAGLA